MLKTKARPKLKSRPKIKPLKSKTWPLQGHWTYQDYLRLPDDGKRYEIIEGVLYMVNAPSFLHQFIVSTLTRSLGNFVAENELGLVLTAPFEVHLSPKTRPVQPDVLFIRNENWPATEAAFFEGPPDLVVEVLSPSTTRTDRFIKFNTYEQAGVLEYWIVNPKTRSVEVYELTVNKDNINEYKLKGEFTATDLIESNLLNGLKLITSTIFSK